MSVLTVGCDPEVPVTKGGKIWHCIGVLGGSKEEPRPVRNGAVQEDNVAFEFNIDPQVEEVAFSEVIQSVMRQGIELLGSEYSISNVASHSYASEDIRTFPESAFTFGCDPDYNALSGCKNRTPSCEDENLRSFGGHVHLGWSHLEPVTEDMQRDIIIACDYLLGLPSLLKDSDTRRRQLYGKAAAYRPKDFGVEYRTLSNFWIFSEEDRKWIFNQAQKAYQIIKDGTFDNYLGIHDPFTIGEIINNNDLRSAEIVLRDLEII